MIGGIPTLYQIFETGSLFLDVISIAMFIYCLLTWIAPQSAICMALERFTAPLVTPFRRLSYAIMRRWGGRIDFTYLLALIGLRIIQRLWWILYYALARIF